MNLARSFLYLGALLLVAAPQFAVAQAQWRFDDVERIVAFSDVHGDYEAMVATLQSAAVIDETLAWSGGATHLVLVGDILDRGPGSRAAMDLLMRLEQEALQADGRVHVLIGNHEVMNIVGDLRYVHAGEYAAFAADESAEERDHWFSAWQSSRVKPGAEPAALRATFDETFPAGFFALRKAFAPDGHYGEWLLQKPMLVVVDGNAFVHGGLPPSVAESGLQGVNRDLVGDVRLYARQMQLLIDSELLLPTDANHDHVDVIARANPGSHNGPAVTTAIADIRRLNDELFSYQSPHWYRGHTYCSELVEGDRIAAALKKIMADRVIVGHTPTPTREVIQRLDGRVIEIDTGMNNAYYKGSGHALIIENGVVSVMNENGEADDLPAPAARRVGARPVAGMSTEDIENLLSFGEAVPASDADKKLFKVTLDGKTLDARFIKGKRGDIYPDAAAYRLDRALDLDMVPVTVKREVDGKSGALQFVPVKRMDEVQRQEQKVGGGAWCPLPEQWHSMMIFDALIDNDARSADSIFYNLTNWQVMLVGFNDAFSTSSAKSKRLVEAETFIGDSWREALQSLDDETLRTTLGDVLDERRIRALVERRDLLLSQ